MVWTFIARLVLGLLLSAISYALSPRPKTEKPQAAGLDDFSIPTAEEGRPIPVVFGTMLITGAERGLGGRSPGRSHPQERRQEVSDETPSGTDPRHRPGHPRRALLPARRAALVPPARARLAGLPRSRAARRDAAGHRRRPGRAGDRQGRGTRAGRGQTEAAHERR